MPESPRWPKPPKVCWPKPLQTYFERHETAADHLAVHYAGWTRGTFTVNCFMSAIALSAALSQKLWPALDRYKSIGIVGVTASLLAIVLYLIANRREVHTRWIEYRILSELLYSAAMLMGLGASPRLRSRLQTDGRDFRDG